MLEKFETAGSGGGEEGQQPQDLAGGVDLGRGVGVGVGWGGGELTFLCYFWGGGGLSRQTKELPKKMVVSQGWAVRCLSLGAVWIPPNPTKTGRSPEEGPSSSRVLPSPLTSASQPVGQLPHVSQTRAGSGEPVTESDGR